MSKFSERHYIKHYRTAHNDIPPEFIDKKQYLCSECPEIYFNKESFNTHIWKHKETSKLPAKQFDCKRLVTIQDILLRPGYETTYACRITTNNFSVDFVLLKSSNLAPYT